MSDCFLTEVEAQNFTGCYSNKGRIHWLKTHGIPHHINSLGKVLITRTVLDVVREQGWRKHVFHTRTSVLKEIAMPRRGIGIYFLIQRKEILYVGRTTNFFVRMAAHDKGDIPFDSVAFIPTASELLDIFEHEYINRFKPKHNVALVIKVMENEA